MISKQPFISIITPCYNGVRFIRECIESVLAQDYQYIEQVIQDNVSTDGTTEILKRYAVEYPDRIRVVSEPDRGEADGLNKAIQRSRGDILLVLNADDALLPHACSWAVTNLAKYPEAAAIYGDEYIIDENSRVIEEFRSAPYDFKKLLCVELIPPAQAAFIRRRCLEQVGFYADEYIDSCPDFEMWVRIGLKFPMQYVPGIITKYRRHPNSQGQRPEMIERFVRGKKTVMDRVFDQTSTSVEIKHLKGRAYRGLLRWAREVCIDAKGDPSIVIPPLQNLLPLNDTDTPLISIITPCYNGVRFIRECIESVLAQDYQYIEQVIQDGVSTDGTMGIIREYIKKYPKRIKFISEPDRGQADGLNKAIQRSRGDILLVLNADDALLPHACSWAVTNLAKYPEAAAIYGDEYIIDENSRVIEEFRSAPYDFKKLLCVELIPPAQAAFIRRRCLEQVGFYADEYIDSCPDFEMWVRLGLSFPIQYVPGFVSCYRHLCGELFEGGLAKTANRFYQAKKLVQDRVFNSPRTTGAIRRLKSRGQIGILFWSAAAQYGLVGGWRGIFNNDFLFQSFWLALQHGYWLWFWQNVYLYSRLLLKRSIYGRG